MDPAASAEIPQGVDLVPNPDSLRADAKRLRHSPTVADPVAKVLDDDNLLIEIIVRLGFPTTLVRASLVCKRWLRHASEPAFLRRFRKLHPPRLLGVYLDARSSSLGYKPTRPLFVPMLPQPMELASAARRVASCSLDAYHNVWLEDCQNGSILIRCCSDGTSTFGAEASSSSPLIHHGDILRPLGPRGAVAIVPCPPHNTPNYSQFFYRYTFFKQGGQDLSYLLMFQTYSLFEEETIKGKKNCAAHVYMLQDGIWCMHTSDTLENLCQTMIVRPLFVENKIYIAGGMRDILVLDLKTSSFSKIQLPAGVEYGESNTVFSCSDDDSRLFLIHVKEFEIHIWLHDGDNWLLEDAISLHEMCDNLRMSDHTFLIDSTAVVKINPVGENAESACLQIGRYVIYLDIKCRKMHRVYEMAEDNQQYLYRVYPFMMIWPPTFPVLEDDTARPGSLVERGGSETLSTRDLFQC
uniref:Uncharacterized protein n=1 Tax=Avena sativa TaxID=4498 RepID=A0ACD5WQQ1_AVESA